MGGGDTVIQSPQAPNYQESMRDILKAQVEMAPQVYASEAKYQPLYNVLQAAQQAFQAQQSLNIARQAYPQIAQMEAAYNQANRAAELQQLQTTLPQYQQAFNALTPGYAQAVAGAGQLAQSAMAQSLNRPVFASYQNAVRDPYGRIVPPAQQQIMPSMISMPPAAQQTGMAPVAAQQTQQQPAADLQIDQGLSDKFLQLSQQSQANVPAMALPPTDPGGPIAPIYGSRVGRGTGGITNQAAIDEQNAKIAQYKADLAAYNQNAPQQAEQMSAYMASYDPAAAMASQAPAATPAATPQAAQTSAIPQPDYAAQTLPMMPAMQTQYTPSEFIPNEGLASNIQNLDRRSVNQYLGTMPGMADYAKFLEQSSRQELAAGRGLTPEEQRIADQTARSAFAARGTALGNQAVGAEILNRSQVANQRYQQRLANAQQAAGTIQAIYQPALAQSMERQQAAIGYGMAQQQAAFQQALQRQQADQQTYLASTQAQAGQAALGAGAMSQLQAAQAPILQAFYKQPILQGQEGQAQQMAMAMQQQAGPQYFNPESQTGMGSIYGAYNAQMNLAGAQAQANAAKSAGQMGMIGAIGGGLLTGAGIAF